MSRLAPTVSALARNTMRAAFEDLEGTITPADSRIIRSTSTLEAVRAAALDIEKQLAARQALRNMRRLTPLLNGLEHYAKAVDVLCNGTPYLAWVWSPITLVLRVAAEYVEAFEKIMKGYSRIADCLRRFETLNCTFNTNPDFQQTLATYYEDILEYHKNAYKFVRRSGWKLLFATSWGRFERKYNNILDDLTRHGELVDLEANALSISEARRMRSDIREWREESLEQTKRRDEEQAARQYREIVSWLKVDDAEQISIFDSIADQGKFLGSTCGWVLKNQKVKDWMQRTPATSLLWIQGNPGAGKSVLLTQLVTYLQALRNPVVRHFCSKLVVPSTKYENILKSILLQLLDGHGELIAHIYKAYVLGKRLPTLASLEQLIQTMFGSMSDEPREVQYTWLVIDGIDECESERQSRLISLLIQITARNGRDSGYVCKVLLSSRSSPLLLKRLRKSMVSLSDENSHLGAAIRQYASKRLQQSDLEEKLRQLDLELEEFDEIATAIAEKADGMFLYARLVLDYLTSSIFYSGSEIKEAVHELPPKLSDFYHEIFTRIVARLDHRSVDRIRNIFGWVAFSKRPLKKLEFLSALSFSPGNPKIDRLVPNYILDICSPLITERRDSTFSFIHVSVKEFLQTSPNGLVFGEHTMLREHGVATVACLISGLDNFHPDCAEETKSMRMIKGVHGFHVYATEYWTEYILTEAVTSEGLHCSSLLFQLASVLAQKLEATAVATEYTTPDTNSAVDNRLHLIQQHDLLHKHVGAALRARSQKRLQTELLHEQAIDPGDKRTVQIPMDGISLMLQSYEQTVRHLVNQDSYPGVSAEELQNFKNHFGTSAYTCRLHSCPRASLGFESESLRREHEITHAGGFRCTEPNCQYPPFRTANLLKTHVDTRHSLTPIRKSIRRIRNLEDMTQSQQRTAQQPHARPSVQSQANAYLPVYPDQHIVSIPPPYSLKYSGENNSGWTIETNSLSRSIEASDTMRPIYSSGYDDRVQPVAPPSSPNAPIMDPNHPFSIWGSGNIQRETLNTNSVGQDQGSEWSNMAAFRGDSRAPSDIHSVSAAIGSPYLANEDSFEPDNPSALLSPQQNLMSFGQFNPNGNSHISPNNDPHISSQTVPTQEILPQWQPDKPFSNNSPRTEPYDPSAPKPFNSEPDNAWISLGPSQFVPSHHPVLQDLDPADEINETISNNLQTTPTANTDLSLAFVCQICGIACSTKSDLLQHHHLLHAGVPVTIQDENKSDSTGCFCGKPPNNRAFQCTSEYCGLRWFHVPCVDLEEPFTNGMYWLSCPRCQTRTPLIDSSMITHSARVVDLSWQCGVIIGPGTRCKAAITCQLHDDALKRLVVGRSSSFDVQRLAHLKYISSEEVERRSRHAL